MEIIARLTADAAVKTLPNDKQVVKFNVAINDSYKPKGSTTATQITTYVQCAYWVGTGIAQYLTKGTLVELQGRLGVNAWNNQQGEAKASITLHVNSIKLHGIGKAANGAKESIGIAPILAGELTEPLDDLPF